MNLNEQNIFDELMRQKLGDYDEAPDMELLHNIHYKKNRILSIYDLKRLLTVLIIAGMVVYGSFMVFKPSANTSISKENKALQIPSSNQIHANNGSSFSSTKNTLKNAIISEIHNPTTIQIHTNTTIPNETYLNKKTITIIPTNKITPLQPITNIEKQTEELSKQEVKTISNLNAKYSITGKIVEGINPAVNGIVKLYIYDNSAFNYTYFTKVKTDANGKYDFTNLPVGKYIILAKSNNNQYLSTYLGNTAEINSAVDISISQNDDEEIAGMNINLLKDNLISYQSATNFGVSEFANSTTYYNSFTNSSYSSNSFNYNTDINAGRSSSASFIESSGSNSSPFSTIQSINVFSANQLFIPNTPSMVNTAKNPNSNSLQVPVTNVTFNSTLNLYPNPAVYSVNFDINTNEEVTADIRILNTTGNIVYQTVKSCKSGNNTFNVDISTLKPGDYYVVVNLQGRQILTGRLTKQADTFR